MSFSKSVTTTKSVDVTWTNEFEWIKGDTEPSAPTGYVRAPEIDLDFGILGKYWGFIKET